LIKLLESREEFGWAEKVRGAYNIGRRLAYREGKAAREEAKKDV
jgi:hypothetical protein